MIKERISAIITNNKEKIREIIKVLSIVAIVILIATIVLSYRNMGRVENTQDNTNNIYNPTATVQKGEDISEEQYVQDTNIIDKFIEYCNNQQIDEAYSLISSSCKRYLYPTINIFKENYYNYIFTEKREYNLQSWVSTKAYTVYKIRYTTNILAEGKYDEKNIYQDYITLIKKSEGEEISIGEFVFSEELNKKTITDKIEAVVQRKNTYLTDEEYEISIKNKTNNVILLDSLQTTSNLKLISSTGSEHNVYINKIFKENVMISPGDTKLITIRFKKTCSSKDKSETIRFSKVITNYNQYLKNKDDYNDYYKIDINL